ncbi:MAG: proteasome accessory factor PafA2 family protein, partial [Nitrospira sp.]|nr:proteasome accessory factor PafA2 family protein [Nitrospira sp.]
MRKDITTHSRVLGTETEFGVAAKETSVSDPVASSIAVIGHYRGIPAPGAIWDYEHENPLLDARGFEVEGERERPSPDYNRQLNKVLANGGRLYVDGAHPEYSTPECSSRSRSDMVALVLLERQVGEALEGLRVAGPERVDQARDEDGGEVDEAALLGEAGDRFVGK